MQSVLAYSQSLLELTVEAPYVSLPRSVASTVLNLVMGEYLALPPQALRPLAES